MDIVSLSRAVVRIFVASLTPTHMEAEKKECEVCGCENIDPAKQRPTMQFAGKVYITQMTPNEFLKWLKTQNNHTP